MRVTNVTNLSIFNDEVSVIVLEVLEVDRKDAEKWTSVLSCDVTLVSNFVLLSVNGD